MNESTENTDLQLLSNFDLSVVIALDKEKLSEFIRLFQVVARYYQRNGIEIILAVDKTIDKDSLLEFVKYFPMIDWKVIKCDSKNPIQRMNTGIRQSEKKFILLIQSEWVFQSDIIYLLRKDLDFYQKHYAIGQIGNKRQGCILAKKEDLKRIKGLDEKITFFTFSFDNLQKRMELDGIQKLYCQDAILLQHDNFPTESIQLEKKGLSELLLPVKAVANDESWGEDCLNTLFDWRNNPFAAEQCQSYLKELIDFQIPNSNVFNITYKLIALIPTYNESEWIDDCLRSVEKHCDGIIVLDDESTDNTYELIPLEKILLKAKKKRTGFNDKQNRNILLDLAYFFRSEWFIFIDADERFDERFVDLRKIMQKPKIDVVGVWIANLWDSMEKYRTDIPDSLSHSQKGLWFRWRMFRNKGRMQFIIPKSFHFHSVPYIDYDYTTINSTLLLHIGYLSSQKRSSKYDFYQKEDYQNRSYYSDILKEKVELAPISLISKDDLILTLK